MAIKEHDQKQNKDVNKGHQKNPNQGSQDRQKQANDAPQPGGKGAKTSQTPNRPK